MLLENSRKFWMKLAGDLSPSSRQLLVFLFRSNFNRGGANQEPEDDPSPIPSSGPLGMGGGNIVSSHSSRTNRSASVALLPEPLSQSATHLPPQGAATRSQQSQGQQNKKLGKLNDGQSTFLGIKDFRYLTE